MSRVLVTGANGFTGRHLCIELARAGHEVHALLRTDSGEAVPGVTAIHAADLNDGAAMEDVVACIRPERVAHLAGVAFVAHGDVESIYRVNLLGTRSLLAALAKLSIAPTAVLLASSANVYGNTAVGQIDETMAPAPANDYAVSKLAMEYMAATWRVQLPITIVRPFNYIGVGQSMDFVVAKIVDAVRRRVPVIELGNLDVERDFSDVRMVVDVYRRLLDLGEPPAGPLNVCSGRGTSLREILAMAFELGDHHAEVRINPAFVRTNEVRRLVGSHAALERAIGPLTACALRDTLRWMLD